MTRELTQDERCRGSSRAGHASTDMATATASRCRSRAASHERRDGRDRERTIIEWPDLTRIELWRLLPLAVLTIVFGVYPKPILDIVGPAFERILLPFMS